MTQGAQVSVITPTFNDAGYLRAAIESVRAQTFGGVEHIVVDGGSTDGTADVLRAYPHLRWISERDRGMYDALNKGLALASGDLVGYLNADDRYLPRTIELVAREFAADPGLDYVYGYCTYIAPDETPICTFRTLARPQALLTTRGRLTFAQPTCFWRRRVHDVVGGFDAGMRISGDADFFCRLLSRGLKGRLIRQPLALFMARATSISKSLAADRTRESSTLRERYRLGPRAWRYALNGPIYYLVNLDAYARYLAYKLKARPPSIGDQRLTTGEH